MSDKTLNVVDSKDLQNKISDVEIFGNADLFKLAAKASSRSQGWMKSTKIMNTSMGAVVQVTTQNKDNVAEAIVYVPNENYDFEKQIWKLI